MGKAIFFLLILLCLEIKSTIAQGYSPGVNQEILNAIDTKVKEHISKNLDVTDVLNVDSSLKIQIIY